MAAAQNEGTPTPGDLVRLKKIVLFSAPITYLSLIGCLAYLGFVESLGMLIFIILAILFLVAEIGMIIFLFRSLDNEP